MKLKRLNLKIGSVAAIIAIALLSPSVAFADKFDLTFGYYSLSATTTKGSSSLSSLGAYSIDYRHAVAPQIEVSLGYSIVTSNSIMGGDLGYGLDIAGYYYPFTQAGEIHYDENGVRINQLEAWRPYVGAMFNQRSFQGIQTGYAGFGGVVGTQRTVNDGLSLVGEIRYMDLSGGDSSTAHVIQMSLGISLLF